MFSRPKGWLPGLLSKPKNPHSLDHLKYLYSILCKNQTITEHNRSLLVETLRSISEILIWGDQNDSSVFDFFLEKNMLSFFLRYLRQKSGRFICVQLLQTLNILFENISNETSLYYLLSNNHINAIIVHKFDFSDEEVMAYYISFLKTLSLKLNKHTIHFFYNEHTNDFALYTEAIKFFNQSEPMVRIAVRTITLNVFKVDDKAMIKYIRNRTAAPYFSNLVWFIGNHILDLDSCVRNDADHQSRNRLSDLVAEHLDHLHYLNDILCINIDALNDVLTDQLLNRLLIPLYVYSLTMRKKYSDRQDKKHVGSVVSLFLLSQVFLIITYSPLVKQLAEIIFQGEVSLSKLEPTRQSPRLLRRVREFRAPEEPLEKTLDNNKMLHNFQLHGIDDMNAGAQEGNSTFYTRPRSASGTSGVDVSSPETEMAMSPTSVSGDTDISSPNQNSTDEEKIYSTLGRTQRLGVDSTPQQKQAAFSLDDRPYLEAIFNALECSENDYEALFALCLLYAMGHNDGIHQGLMDSVLMPTERSETKDHYNVALVERLIRIITLACQHGSKVRLATLELGIKLLKQLVYKPGKSFLQDRHLACIENAKECSTQLLRNFYKSEEIFLDMFEDEYREMIHRPLNVEYLTMDASILLPPTGTPLTGIHFNKRLPCGEVERARRKTEQQLERKKITLEGFEIVDKDHHFLIFWDREFIEEQIIAKFSVVSERYGDEDLNIVLPLEVTVSIQGLRVTVHGFKTAIRVFFLVRDLSLSLLNDEETQLPLTKEDTCVKERDILDLNNSDLIACTVITKESRRQERRFLVIDSIQMILVEPDTKRLGWGVVRFVGFLQDVEVTGDKDDSRSLHITIHKPASSQIIRPVPLLSARFLFDDHIRCMAAKQRLSKGRIKARQQKMQMIERLLDIPADASGAGQPGRSKPVPGRSHPVRVTSTTSDNSSAKKQQNKTDQSGQSKSEKSESSDTGQVDSCSSSQTDNIDDVEIAEEAFAYQSFNQHTGGASSSPAPMESTSQVQEIPLEDLSKKKKKHSARKIANARISGMSASGPHSRSHSHSPKRDEGIKSANRGRSTSLIVVTNKRERSSTPKRREHSKSSPLPMPSSPAKSTTSSDDSPDNYRSRDREKGSQSPKTLRPAEAPTLSLLPQGEDSHGLPSAGVGTPKLVQPAGVDRIRSLSDTSSTSSESQTDLSSVTKIRENLSMPDFAYKTATGAEVEVNSASMDKSNVAMVTDKGTSASDQLTKLAQIVQEHYKFSEAEQETSLNQTSSSD